VWCWKKEIRIMNIIKGSTFNLERNSWGQLGKFQSPDQNILEFMIEKKRPSLYQREYK
jgi:hypothetical protein